MKRDLEMTIKLPKEMERDFRLFIVMYGGSIENVKEITENHINNTDTE